MHTAGRGGRTGAVVAGPAEQRVWSVCVGAQFVCERERGGTTQGLPCINSKRPLTCQIRTSDLEISDVCHYSLPLYQLS